MNDKISEVVRRPDVLDVEQVADELERFFTGEPSAVGRQPFEVTNLDQADWCMQQLGALDATAREYADTITLWEDARRRVLVARAWFEERLREWAIANRTEQRKSFPLAHGTVSTRRTGPKIELVDEDAALPSVEQHAPDAVKVTKSIQVSRLGDAVRVATIVTGYDALNQSTGETQHIEVKRPTVLDEAVLHGIRDRMPGWTVTPVTHLEARAADGSPVPGFDVRPEVVSATPKPSGL